MDHACERDKYLAELTTKRQVINFLFESNKIEGIKSIVASEEEAAFNFLSLEEIKIEDLCNYVNATQPGAKLRDRIGLDVQVGNHVPIPGGYEVKRQLDFLLLEVDYLYKNNLQALSPYLVHLKYEDLHPFTDGNGRSGRLLWAWMMLRKYPTDGLARGFLHQFYYQTLENSR